jgi:hypothetical protein
MTPQEYSLLTRLVQGCATWKNYVQTLISNPQIVNLSNYAAILSTTTQVSGGTTTANKVLLDTVDTANGITLSNNELVFSNSGSYLINWLGQFRFVGGTSNSNITTWYTVNGVAAPNSSYTFTLPSTTQGAQFLTNVEDINSINAGDRVAFYWWTDISPAGGNGISLTYTPAGSNPSRPASPSAKITVSQLN